MSNGGERLVFMRGLRAQNSPFLQIFSTIVTASIHPDCLLGLYWTGLTVLNEFFLFFFLFILGRAVRD